MPIHKKVSLLFILVLTALLWGGEYLRRDLWEPDEARYAQVTREMRNSGDWLVMHRQGEPYSHKPPLFFWITGLAASLTGGEIGRLAPRIPSYIGAVMTLWVVSRLGAQWFSRRAAWLAVLLLSSSFLFWNKGGFGQIDALLCGLEMMALYLFYTASEGRARLRLMGAYALMGLAVLAKGPVGFVVPWGVFLTTFRFHPPARTLPKSHFLWGPVITLAFPALWLFAAWMRGAPDDYLHELLFAQNVGRATGEFGGHVRPFWYFLKYIPVDFLPWSLLLPLAAATHLRARSEDRAALRLAVWMIFIVLFFSLSASKRNLYILGVYPAAALFVAGAADKWECLSSAWHRNSFIPVFLVIHLMGLALLAAPFLPGHPIPVTALWPGGVLMITGAWTALHLWRKNRKGSQWIFALAVAVLATFSSVGTLAFPAVNDLKTPQAIIEPAQRLLKPDERIIMYRQHGEIFSLYTNRLGKMIDTPEELRTFIGTSGQTHHFILFFDHSLDDIRSVVQPQHEPVEFSMGSKTLYYLGVEPPGAPQ